MRSMAVLLSSSMLALMVACTGRPTGSPPDGGRMVSGPVYVDQTELISLETYPVQVVLQVKGHLPDPCHKSVWSVSGPDPRGRIDVDLHSEAPAEQICIQMVAPLDVQIPLGSFQQGSTTVWLNGSQVGVFAE